MIATSFADVQEVALVAIIIRSTVSNRVHQINYNVFPKALFQAQQKHAIWMPIIMFREWVCSAGELLVGNGDYQWFSHSLCFNAVPSLVVVTAIPIRIVLRH